MLPVLRQGGGSTVEDVLRHYLRSKNDAGADEDKWDTDATDDEDRLEKECSGELSSLQVPQPRGQVQVLGRSDRARATNSLDPHKVDDYQERMRMADRLVIERR